MEDVEKISSAIANEHVRKWKESGGRVIGYTCVATPTEIITAAGLLPFRVRALGHSDTERADARLSRFNCSFCRSCLQLGLDGTYDFLDGMIETNGCDHLRGMIENWNYARPFPFFHYLKVPHILDPDSLAYFEEDLRRFAKSFADHFDADVSDEVLWSNIREHDRVRDRLRTVYEMRERDRPAFTGAEALSIFLACTAAPSALVETMLDRVIASRKDHSLTGFRARLLLAGAATDEIAFVREIENMGGLMVTDALCYGARAFWPRLAEQHETDPYKALAKTYLEKLLCPRMFNDFASRKQFVFDAVKRAKVDGVILVNNKFCDLHGVDNVQLRLALEKAGVPVLQLEKEYGAGADLGRLKTRVQAFLERIGERP